jgi:signal transduction histidine kinase
MEGLLDTDVPPRLAADTVAALCEDLANIVRHASATSADILLRAGDNLLLTVTDNGRSARHWAPLVPSRNSAT